MSMLVIHLPSSEPGRAAVFGWWERHEVRGEEELQLSHGRAPASPLGATALTQGSSTAQGLGVSSGELALQSLCFLHLCEVRAPGPLAASPSAVTPSSASAQRDSC